MKRIILGVGGMSCQHCLRAVEKALLGVAGVRKVQVDLANSRAVVECDEAVFDLQKAGQAIVNQGYDYLGPIG
jgi:copper chaperone